MTVPRLVVRAFSVLVPAARRAAWMAEWLAELEHARSRGAAGAALTLRAVGSLGDALWIRRRHVVSWRLGRTVREATRALVRRPGYSLTVIATLALGIGSATGIFTVVDALLLRPIPFEDPDRLVTISRSARSPLPPDAEALREWRAQDRIFSDVRAHQPRGFILTGAGDARSEMARLVEPGFLEMLGVRPVLGRSFTEADAVPGNEHVLLLGDDLWREAFARDPHVVGRVIELDGQPFTVIGVMPPSVRLLLPAVVRMVVPLSDEQATGAVWAMGRLRPDLSVEVAQERLDEVSRELQRERPRESGWDVTLTPLERVTSHEAREGLFALGGGVLCLLLISCANAAGLLLLRGVQRRKELELRLALGASRGSLGAQVLVESLMLAVVAGSAGMLLAWGCVQGLIALLPPNTLTFSYTVVTVDRRVLSFALGLTLLTGLVSGTIPAIRAARTTVDRAGRGATSSREDVRLRSGMQVAQLALAVLLLSGAGLFVRSFQQMMTVPLGYDVDRLLRVDLVSLERLRGRDATEVLTRVMDQRLRELPGVEAVGRAESGTSIAIGYTLQTESGEPRVSGEQNLLPYIRVDTAYFRTMGIPFVEGRGFDSSDLADEANTVVIDRDLARYLWPSGTAVGRSFRIREGPWLRVVGVTEDVKLDGPRDPYGPYLIFYPGRDEVLRNPTVLLRAADDEPARLAPMVQALVRELDPTQPIRTVETGRQALGEAVADPRLFLVVMAALAGAALTLAVVGVYGLASFTVERGRREIGIRVALGARTGRVVADVVRRGLALGVVGLMIGMAATLAFGRFVEALLFGTSTVDPIVLASAGAVLLASCAGALARPALRAASTDPAEVLRSE